MSMKKLVGTVLVCLPLFNAACPNVWRACAYRCEMPDMAIHIFLVDWIY